VGASGGGTHDHEDIEGTKAAADGSPDRAAGAAHQGLVAFGITFIGCFFFAKQIYNVLTWPYVWVRVPRTPSSSTPGSSNTSWCSSRSRCSAPLHLVPDRAAQLYMFVAPGLYKHERNASCVLVATPIFFFLGSMVVYFLVWPI